jgi:DDE superfamily endonuclease
MSRERLPALSHFYGFSPARISTIIGMLWQHRTFWLKKFSLPVEERHTHLYCIGTTGQGKSKFLENVLVQDILAGRAAALSEPAHRIQFVFVPKHTSWLNQVEIWFNILVRRVVKRGNFTSQDDLRAKILAFVDYFKGARVGVMLSQQQANE